MDEKTEKEIKSIIDEKTEKIDEAIEVPVIKNIIKTKSKSGIKKNVQFKISIPKKLATSIGMDEDNVKEFNAKFFMGKKQSKLTVEFIRREA